MNQNEQELKTSVASYAILDHSIGVAKKILKEHGLTELTKKDELVMSTITASIVGWVVQELDLFNSKYKRPTRKKTSKKKK